MANIVFNIILGTAPYHVELIPDIGTHWTFGSNGIKTIHNIPAGDYQLKITDANGCVAISKGDIIITTTTTTEEPVTTTTEIATTTTEEQATTTTPIPETTTTTTYLPCVEYGLLYNWYAATDARNIAPSGWHVPSQTELTTLLAFADPLGDDEAPNLCEIGSTYWTWNVGTNVLGFSARGSGEKSWFNGAFAGLRSYCYLWSTTSGAPGFAKNFTLYGGVDEYIGNSRVNNGNTIRLIKDDTNDEGTMTGNDGKIYKTVTIDTQVWMAENLMETEYRNHDSICECQDDTQWIALTTGAMCAYNNDYDNVGCGFSGGVECTTTTTEEPVTTTTEEQATTTTPSP